MKNRIVGYIIIGIATLIGFIIYVFNRALTQIVGVSCSHGESCVMWSTINFQTNVAIGVMIFVILIGAYLIIFGKEAEVVPKKVKTTKETFSEQMKNMTDDEKQVFGIILEDDGSHVQSELVEKTQFNKVKITRILDKLEGKGLIERKRRGMSNIVILKH